MVFGTRKVLLAAVTAVGLLAACSSGGGGASGVVTINPGGSHAPVNLTMWSGFTNPEFKILGHAVAMFEHRFPWIHVTMVPGKQDTDVLNAIHSGTPPDVMMLTVPDDAVEFCDSGAYIDMAPYLRAYHVDLRSLVPAGALAYTAFASKTSQCMLPMLTDAYGLYYNTTMFKAAGISSPPKTYSEFLADAKKLTQFNTDGSIKVAGFLPIATGDYELANYVNGNSIGARWYDKSGKNALASDPRFATMLEFVKSMTNAFGFGKLNQFFSGSGGENTEFSPSNLFENGKVAMVIDGEWRVAFIKRDHSNVQYATAPFPVSNSTPQLYGSGQIGGSTLGIPRGSAHPNEAFLLVKFLSLDPAAERYLAEQLGNVPTLTSALTDPKLTNDPHFAMFLKIFANPHSIYKQITKLGFGDVQLYDAFVDKYLAGNVPDLHAGLSQLATQIDNQVQLGQ